MESGAPNTITSELPFLKEGESFPSFMSAQFGNQVIAFLNCLKRMKGNGVKLTWSDYNLTLDVESTGKGVSGIGLFFGSTILYDPAQSYIKGQVVFVITNQVVGTTPIGNGFWVCVQDCTGSAHGPTWPCPTPYNPDAANNYWFPLATTISTATSAWV